MYRSFNDSEDSDNEYGNSSDSEVDSDESRQVIERGPLSTVRRVRRKCSSDDPPWIAVKTSFTSRTSSKQPHDVIKEVRLLSKLSHVNVVELLDYTYDQSSRAMHLWMPYIPIPFHKVLNSPLFSPFPFPFVPALPNAIPTKEVEALSSRFLVISKSLTFQIISAIAYLHSPPNNIAHRDIKPRNLLLTEEGYIKLIDFGISWKEDESEQDQKDDLWPERKENMCAAVSTGPYRAPELLFTPKSYNAFSADLWSLGATLAELFTPLSLQASSSSYSDDEDADSPVLEDDTPPPFILSPNINMEYPDPDLDHDWVRTSLFDGSRGELGLIWSIFKTMGTPNESSWPGYKDLVSSMNITFIEVPGVPLESRLPNLPPPMMTTPRTVTTAPRTNGFDLVSALLVYPPEDRLKANDALSHPWLTSDDVPLLLASGYSLRAEQEHVKSQVIFDWKTRSLGDLTKEVLMWNGQSQDHDTRETGRKWK